MHEDTQRSIDQNVRRTVGIAALRRIRELLTEWEFEERRSRRIALVTATLLVTAVIAVAAYYYGSLRLVTIN